MITKSKLRKGIFFLVVLLSVFVTAQIFVAITSKTILGVGTSLDGGRITVVRGANEVKLPIFLDNEEPIVGFQFKIDSPEFFKYKDVETTSRMSGNIIITNEGIGFLSVASLIENGLEIGKGRIFNIIIDVDENAIPGDYILGLSEVFLVDIGSNLIETKVEKGIITIVAPYNINFLAPLVKMGKLSSLQGRPLNDDKVDYTLQKGATLPLRFNVTDENGEVVEDDSVKVIISNEELGFEKEFIALGSRKEGDFVKVGKNYEVIIHSGELDMPKGIYEIEISFDNFQKEIISFELVEKGEELVEGEGSGGSENKNQGVEKSENRIQGSEKSENKSQGVEVGENKGQGAEKSENNSSN